MIQNPASRRSMRTIVAVAARLIRAFRQKPSQARLRLKATNVIIDRAGSVHAVVDAADLVADDAALLEGHDPLAEGGHDVGVVGCHEDGDT